jgi:hypothetical protein
MSFPSVYVIESRKKLSELCEYLNQCGGYVTVQVIYRWSSKEKRLVETKDKTLVICQPHTARQLEAAYPEQFGGHVKDYDWESFPSPNVVEGETHNLHVAGIPNDFSENDAVDYIHKQLTPILGADQYKTDFKLRSRATGEISGFGEISFKSEVDLYLIKLCKLMLHNKPLSSKKNQDHTMMVRCVWHKVVSATTGESSYSNKKSREAEADQNWRDSKGKGKAYRKPVQEFSRRTLHVRPVKSVDVSTVGVISQITKADPPSQQTASSSGQN